MAVQLILQYKTGTGVVPPSWTTLLNTTYGDSGIGIAPHSSGNVYAAGRYYDGGTYDTVVFKVDTGGDVQWQRAIQTNTQHQTETNLVAVDSSEDIYVAATVRESTRDRNLLVKYNSSGVIQWQRKLYNTGYHVSATGIALDSSSNVYVVCYTFEFGSIRRGLVLKYNSSGVLQWERVIATPSATEDVYLYGITVDDNNDVLVVGRSEDESAASVLDTVVMKLSSAGAITWQQFLKLRSPDLSTQINGVVTDTSNNVFVTGNTWNSTQDCFVAKLNSSGTLQWARGINDATASDDHGQSIDVDSSGNVYVSARKGTTYKNVRLVKWNTSGTVQWTREYGTTDGEYDTTIKVDGSGLIHLCGSSTYGGTYTAIYIAKLDELGTFSTFTYEAETVTEEAETDFTVSAGDLTSTAGGIWTEEAAGLTEGAGSLTEINYPLD